MPTTNFTKGVRVGAAIKTAAYSITSEDAGRLIVADAADLTITLPATVAGMEVTIALGPNGLSTGTGLLVDCAAADKVFGNGFTAAAGKGALLAGAGDRIGDSITLVGDGSTGWFITAVTGTWTREA